jgi:hypothetical protein
LFTANPDDFLGLETMTILRVVVTVTSPMATDQDKMGAQRC